MSDAPAIDAAAIYGAAAEPIRNGGRTVIQGKPKRATEKGKPFVTVQTALKIAAEKPTEAEMRQAAADMATSISNYLGRAKTVVVRKWPEFTVAQQGKQWLLCGRARLATQ